MRDNRGKPPAGSFRANALSLVSTVALIALYWVFLRLGAPIGVEIVVTTILIIWLVTSTVRFFRVLLKASQEEVERNPKPW